MAKREIMALKKKYIALILSVFLLIWLWPFLTFNQRNLSPNQLAAQIPIQHNGRIKSLDAFARETLELISGKESWEKKPAIVLLLENLNTPNSLLNIAFVRLDHLELKKTLGLPSEEKYFSYNQLKPSFPRITSLVQSAGEKRDREERTSTLEQSAELLYNRLMAVDQLSAGETLKVIPGAQSEAWESPYVVNNSLSKEFKDMITLYSAKDTKSGFITSAQNWIHEVSVLSKEPFTNKLRMEIIYYKMKPFSYSWMLYLTAFILLTFFQSKPIGQLSGIITLMLGFLFHTGGLLLRVLILSRPPVSNMFESVIFMNWILMVFAFIFYLIRKQNFFFSCGALASVLVMLFANRLPVDKSLDVLAPVLKSNYWLTVHVLTIVSSYGIFGLAMILGHRHLLLKTIGRLPLKEEAISAHVLNRLLQIGLIALGIGTVLGGVWANESWGRFWGWDPKETWALITFLGYMVVLHFRHVGKLSDFALAACAVLGFLLVMMTWYGVNFILGRGLHSYGFGAGNIKWAVYYLVVEAVFFGFVLFAKGKKV